MTTTALAHRPEKIGVLPREGPQQWQRRFYDEWYYQSKIVQSYEKWYEGPRGRQMDRLEKRLIARFLEQLDPVARLLEIGCGTTHFTRWLSGQVPQVVGLPSGTTGGLAAAGLFSGALVLAATALMAIVGLSSSAAPRSLLAMVSTVETAASVPTATGSSH